MAKPGRRGRSKGLGARPSVPKFSRNIGGVESLLHKRLCEIIVSSPRTRPPPPTPPYNSYAESGPVPQVGGLQPVRRCIYGELPTNAEPSRPSFSASSKSRVVNPVGHSSTPFVPSLLAPPPPSPTVTPAPRVPRKSSVPAKPSPLCRSWVIGKRGLKSPTSRRAARLDATTATTNPTTSQNDPMSASPLPYVPVMPSYHPPGTPSTNIERVPPPDVAMLDLGDQDVEMVDPAETPTQRNEGTHLASPLSSLVTPAASTRTQGRPKSPSAPLLVQPQPPPLPPIPPLTLEASSLSSCTQEQATYAPSEPRRFDPNFLAHMGASSSSQQDRPPAIIGQRPQDIDREIRQMHRKQVEVGDSPCTGPLRSLHSLIEEVKIHHQEPRSTESEARRVQGGNPDARRFHVDPRPFRSVQTQAYASSSNTSSSSPSHTPRVQTYTTPVPDQDRNAIQRANLKRKAAFEQHEFDSAWQHPLANWIDVSEFGTMIGEESGINGTTTKKRRTCISQPANPVSKISLPRLFSLETDTMVRFQSNLKASTSLRTTRPHRTLRRSREERKISWTSQPHDARFDPRLTQTLQYANELKRYVRRLVIIPHSRPHPNRRFPQVPCYASSTSSSCGSETLSSMPGTLSTTNNQEFEVESSNPFVSACNWIGITFRRVGQSLLGDFS